MNDIFAYGSLMVPAVMVAVTGRDFLSIPARLPGYARYRVRGEPYPGIIPAKEAGTEGILYLDLDPAAVNRLYDFEGEWYERVFVRVLTLQGKTAEADTYVFRVEHRHLLTAEEWDREIFESEHLKAFMETSRGFQERR